MEEKNNNENLEVVEVETQETEETLNTVKISNDAVATYAGIAIAEIPGVYGMSGTLARNNRSNKWKEKLYKRSKS